MNLVNRGRQYGPVGGMGQRPNAQGYDLNRDHMKLDSPEARSVARLFSEYDPHVAVDLHTTNGTRHAYHLTYSPPLHPNTPAEIDDFLREGLFPHVTGEIREKYGWEYYYYGNASTRGGDAPGWYTFDHRPRFNNNYLGLRNRIGILSEAYSYATFEERVLATLHFVEEILDYVHEHAAEVRRIVADADAALVTGDSLALRAAPERSAAPVDILMGATAEEAHPLTGRPLLLRADTQYVETMYEYGTFAPTLLGRVPEAYLIPADLSDVQVRLAAHGVALEPAGPAPLDVEAFRIDSVRTAERPFQGRNEQTLFGRHEPDRVHAGPRGHAGADRPAARTPSVQPARAAVGRRLRELGVPRGPAAPRRGVSHRARPGQLNRGADSCSPSSKGRSVQTVQGFGGFFFRAKDPAGLAKWYEDHLGINPAPTNMEMEPWVTESGVTVFAPFAADTDYFAAEKAFMLNFRVADLDAMIAQLKAADIEVTHESEMEGVGRFARIHDPEGNAIELWEPAS